MNLVGVTASDYLLLSLARLQVPGQPAPRVLWRWCRKGVAARNCKRIRLRHVRIGGRIYTKAKWLEEFFQATADEDLEHFKAPEPTVSKPPVHSLSHYEADAALRKAGM